MHVTDEPGLKHQDVEIEETIDPTGWPKPSNVTEPPRILRPTETLDPRFFKTLDTRTKKQKAKLAKIARKKNRNK